MRVTKGGEEIPLNVVRLCEMEVSPNGALVEVCTYPLATH